TSRKISPSLMKISSCRKAACATGCAPSRTPISPQIKGSLYMFNLDLTPRADGALKILCLGAHCDDIEIGCGGTILKLLEEYRKASVYWVVFSSDERRAE